MPSVQDQGNLGSCTAHSTTYNIHYMANYHSKIKRIQPIFASRPSRLFEYANSRILDGTALDDDAGSSLRSSFKAVSLYGACDESDWDYQPQHYFIKPSQIAYSDAKKHKYFQYNSVEQTELALKQALVHGHPISFGIQVYDSFMSDKTIKSGIVPIPNTSKETLQGGHAIMLCSYNDSERMFIFENSWGTSVGLPQKQGFFKIPYDYVLDPNLASDFWVCQIFY